MTEENTKKSALFVATLVSFLAPFMGSAVQITLPSIGREFTLGAIALNWVSTSYLLASAVFLVPCGRLADMYGRKKIFTRGVYIYTLAAVLAAIAPGPSWLIASRVVQALGSSMMFGTCTAILTSVFPPGERGKILGINVAAVYLGLSCGPFFGGVLTHHFGWRSVFWVNLPLCAAIIALTLRNLRGEWMGAPGQKFDRIGFAIYSFTLLCLMIGVSLLPDPKSFWLVALGSLGFCLFVHYENQAACPLIRVGMFLHNRLFAFSNLSAFIHYGANFAVGFLMSLYLQYIKDLGAREAGIVLLCQPLVQAFLSPMAGKLSDRLEPRILASSGMACSALGLFTLSSLRMDTPLPAVVLSLCILGFGFALFSSPNANAIMGCVGKDDYGFASSMASTMRVTGMLLSMGTVMTIFALNGRFRLVPENYPILLASARTAFQIFAGLCTFGILISLARGNRPGESESGNPSPAKA